MYHNIIMLWHIMVNDKISTHIIIIAAVIIIKNISNTVSTLLELTVECGELDVVSV